MADNSDNPVKEKANEVEEKLVNNDVSDPAFRDAVLKFALFLSGLILIVILYIFFVAGDALPAEDSAVNIPAATAAQEELAEQLELPNTENIAVVSSEEEEWPNSCLGLPDEDEMCAQAIVEGYEITLEYEGEEYTARTNLTGSNVRIEKD